MNFVIFVISVKGWHYDFSPRASKCQARPFSIASVSVVKHYGLRVRRRDATGWTRKFCETHLPTERVRLLARSCCGTVAVQWSDLSPYDVRARVCARRVKCPGFISVINAGVRQLPIRKETRVLVGNGWHRKRPMHCRQLCDMMLSVNYGV